jgi:hypothetical protein
MCVSCVYFIVGAATSNDKNYVACDKERQKTHEDEISHCGGYGLGARKKYRNSFREGQMPVTWNPVDIGEVELVAESVGKATEDLSRICQKAKEGGLSTVWLPWTQATLSAAGVISSAAAAGISDIEEQVLSHKLKRPCRAERQKTKSARDVALRKEKRDQSGIAPKKRGRPRKTP